MEINNKKKLIQKSLQIIREIDLIFNEIYKKIDTIFIYNYTGYLTPKIKKQLEKLRLELNHKLLFNAIKSIRDGEDFAYSSNENLLKKYLLNYNASSYIKKNLVKTGAKIDIRYLSTKIWSYTGREFTMIETVLQSGFTSKFSANSVKNELVKFLNNPNAISLNELRRLGIEKAGGEIAYRKLEKEIAKYKPGRGVYKSAKANAKRLVVNENNLAFRRADFKQMNKFPFVKGWKVQLSGQHSSPDMCDDLQGDYPVKFQFTGWHVRCYCFATAILATPEQAGKVVRGEAVNINNVLVLPKMAQGWIKDNAETLNNYKTLPYWLDDNKKLIKNVTKKIKY